MLKRSIYLLYFLGIGIALVSLLFLDNWAVFDVLMRVTVFVGLLMFSAITLDIIRN